MFAFNPDDRPARLFRYVDRGTLPSVDLLAVYDYDQNLLIIDRDYFQRLSETDKHLVLRTHCRALRVIPYLSGALTFCAFTSPPKAEPLEEAYVLE